MVDYNSISDEELFAKIRRERAASTTPESASSVDYNSMSDEDLFSKIRKDRAALGQPTSGDEGLLSGAGDYVLDLGRKLKSGTGQGISSLGWFAGLEGAEKYGTEMSQAAEAAMTPLGAERSNRPIFTAVDNPELLAEREAQIRAGAQNVPFGDLVNFNPSGLAKIPYAIAESAPGMVAGMATAAGIEAAVPIGVMAGIGGLTLRALGPLARGASMSPAALGSRVVGSTAIASTEALQAGAMSGQQTEKQALDYLTKNPGALQESEIGRASLEEANGDVDAAIKATAARLGMEAFYKVGAATGILSVPGAALQSRMISRTANQGLLKEIGIGAVGEAAQEGPQSAAEAYFGGDIMGQIDPSKKPTFGGVLSAGLEGALIGAPMGGGMGVIGKMISSSPDPDAALRELEDSVRAMVNSRDENVRARALQMLAEIDEARQLLLPAPPKTIGGKPFGGEDIIDVARAQPDLVRGWREVLENPDIKTADQMRKALLAAAGQKPTPNIRGQRYDRDALASENLVPPGTTDEMAAGENNPLGGLSDARIVGFAETNRETNNPTVNAILDQPTTSNIEKARLIRDYYLKNYGPNYETLLGIPETTFDDATIASSNQLNARGLMGIRASQDAETERVAEEKAQAAFQAAARETGLIRERTDEGTGGAGQAAIDLATQPPLYGNVPYEGPDDARVTNYIRNLPPNTPPSVALITSELGFTVPEAQDAIRGNTGQNRLLVMRMGVPTTRPKRGPSAPDTTASSPRGAATNTEDMTGTRRTDLSETAGEGVTPEPRVETPKPSGPMDRLGSFIGRLKGGQDFTVDQAHRETATAAGTRAKLPAVKNQLAALVEEGTLIPFGNKFKRVGTANDVRRMIFNHKAFTPLNVANIARDTGLKFETVFDIARRYARDPSASQTTRGLTQQSDNLLTETGTFGVFERNGTQAPSLSENDTGPELERSFAGLESERSFAGNGKPMTNLDRVLAEAAAETDEARAASAAETRKRAQKIEGSIRKNRELREAMAEANNPPQPAAPQQPKSQQAPSAPQPKPATQPQPAAQPQQAASPEEDIAPAPDLGGTAGAQAFGLSEATTDQEAPQGASGASGTGTNVPTSKEALAKARKVVANKLRLLRASGKVGAEVADKISKLLKDTNFDAEEIIRSFAVADALSKTFGGTDADPRIEFHKNIVATDPATGESEEIAGEAKAATTGSRGLVKISLSKNIFAALSRDTAFHEGFHFLQDMIDKYDPETGLMLFGRRTGTDPRTGRGIYSGGAFRDGMTLNDVDPSIRRTLQNAAPEKGGVSYWDILSTRYNSSENLRSDFAKQREAVAYIFGALADAQNNGSQLGGLKPAFRRFLNFLTQFAQNLRNSFRSLGYTNTTKILSEYAAGKRQQGYGKDIRGDTSSGTTEAERSERAWVGNKGKNWPVALQNEAERLERDGDKWEDVYWKTGLYRGEDGKWRREVPDINAKIDRDKLIYELFYGDKNGNPRVDYNRLAKLTDVYQHKDIYDEYPFLKSYRIGVVDPSSDANGSHNRKRKIISISGNRLRSFLNNESDSDINIRSTFTHEIQHAIQNEEGWSSGANDDLIRLNVKDEGSMLIKRLAKNGKKEVLDPIEKIYEFANKKLFKDFRNRNGVSVDLTDYIKNSEDPKFVKLSDAYNGGKGTAPFAIDKDASAELLKELKKEPDFKYVEAARSAAEDAAKILNGDYDLISSTMDNHDSFEAYLKNAGETESRDTQGRLKLTEEELRKTLPGTMDETPAAPGTVEKPFDTLYFDDIESGANLKEIGDRLRNINSRMRSGDPLDASQPSKPKGVVGKLRELGGFEPERSFAGNPRMERAIAAISNTPLTQDVYHGTEMGFNIFKDQIGTTNLSLGLGVHVSRDPRIAGNEYFTNRSLGGGGRVLPLKTFPDSFFFEVRQDMLPGRSKNTKRTPSTVRSDDGSIAIEMMSVAFKEDPEMFEKILVKSKGFFPKDASRVVKDLVEGRTTNAIGKDYDNIYDFVQAFNVNLYDPKDQAEVTRLFRKHLIENGYAGVKYINTSRTEVKGSKDPICYVILPEVISTGHFPIRSRFAKFAEKDIASPNIERAFVGASEPEFKRGSIADTNTMAFKRWFKNSVVRAPDTFRMIIDPKTGQRIKEAVMVPLKVYHGGTFRRGRDIPMMGRSGTSEFPYDFMHFGTKKAALARTSTFDEAGAEAKGMDVTPAYLSIQRPKYVKDQGTTAKWSKEVEKAKAEGYDGLIYTNEYEDIGSTSYVIFDPGQAKSTDNVGTFNSADPRIERAFVGKRPTPPKRSIADLDENLRKIRDAGGRKGFINTGKRAAAISDWITAKFDPKGTLPKKDVYRVLKNFLMGNVKAIEVAAAARARVINKGTKAERRQIFDYLKTKNAVLPNTMPAELRDMAIMIKQEIAHIGRQLVAKGILSQKQVDANDGAYLPVMYMQYLKESENFGGAFRGSKREYAMKKSDIPKEIREAMGEIMEPGLPYMKAAVIPVRDMAIIDFLSDIASFEDAEWVAKGDLVEWRGAKVSPFWLSEQMRDVRDNMLYFQDDPVTLANMKKVADEMQVILDKTDMRDDVGKNFKRLPNTSRYGALRGMAVRKEIYQDIVGAGTYTGDLDFFSKLFSSGGVVPKAVNTWKLSKTVFSPTTHARQFFSNMIVADISGISMPMIPVRMVQAIDDMINDTGGWKIAKDNGVTATGVVDTEMRAALNDLKRLAKAATGGVFSVVDLNKWSDHWITKLSPSNLYQGSDYLFKTMKIIDEMKRYEKKLGAPKDDADRKLREGAAVLEANEWFMDYSDVHEWVKTARQTWLPFVTYQYKIAPKIAETMLKNPQRFAKYVALFYAIPALAMAMMDLDDDDIERLKNATKSYVRKNPHALPLPWQDASGDFQFLDVGYLFPWSFMSGLVVSAYNAATGEAPFSEFVKATTIFGSPVLTVVAAFSNIDTFSGKEIVNKYDTPMDKAKDVLGYIWDLAMPPILTNYGAIGAPLADWFSGDRGDIDRKGNPKRDTAQLWLQAFGFNVYPVNPAQQFAQNVMMMQNDINRARADLSIQIRSKNMSPENRREMIEKRTADIQRRIREMQKYIAEARPTERLLKK